MDEEELELENGKFIKFHWNLDANGKKYLVLTQHFKKDNKGNKIYDGKVTVFQNGKISDSYAYKNGALKGFTEIFNSDGIAIT